MVALHQGVFRFAYPLFNSRECSVFVFRLPELPIERKVPSALLQTKYQYVVGDGGAPSVTNCVTAVRYLLGKLPHGFIGDMPRMLVAECGYVLKKVTIGEIQFGDLIFFKWKGGEEAGKKRYICHIACGLGPGAIFHSSNRRRGGCVENWAYPVDVYARELLNRAIDQPFLFLRYVDPRNQMLRRKLGTEWVPFAVPTSLPITLEERIYFLLLSNQLCVLSASSAVWSG